MVSFVGARIFTTMYPHTWVIVGGIHIHHFWYGLGMLAIAGWLGIVSTVPTYRRLYALVFGLGGGLIGDEIGLLLTFGNACYREKLRDDVTELGFGERLVHVGVLVAGLSALAFSHDALVGILILVAGIIIALGGRQYKRRHPSI
jgi:hypothetical protein